MNTLIEVEQLYRYYGDHCAVKNVGFTLEKGEILGFLGPNGAGKSTTMQIICGNLAPSSGRIMVNGVDMLDQPREAKRALGYLPEIPPLYRELTVDEYLEYCAQLHRIPRRLQARALATAKDRCGLSDVGARLINNLSKGYQQRVGIAQAIIHMPAVIILDEPTVGLDPIQIREIRELIRELGKEHGVILSTHILPEVQESCTHVQIIHQGQLVLKDTIDGLERQMRNSSLLLTTARPLDIERLSGVDTVQSVDDLGEHQYRIYHEKDGTPAEQIARTVVESGCGLLEMVAERRSMEQVFIDMTHTADPLQELPS
ncbi:ATP-binding cassette domain-containing protein [Candidatus Methylospira mobilis]|uniref:ATP-binding cassette domain-containing protein n=1 Tax=Candidatus Methylospira mobilis TaxID=1808979 RepID=A0A5Q0BQ18_9GAMM|nr:ATP-binding cassette domain-containing protein [Candidatus Methylospira mobilis]QFY44391.1 ATP-binding cassette domain-containing protein [Candidatus Methylospira mobilis]WNV06173.1 ATP-binding cassette domain-containing protein [Candidatus Methylospira mobilis]